MGLHPVICNPRIGALVDVLNPAGWRAGGSRGPSAPSGQELLTMGGEYLTINDEYLTMPEEDD